MSYAIYDQERPLSTNDHLRGEPGWSEVRSGLGKILWGYLIIIGGSMLGGGLIAVAVIHLIKTLGAIRPGQAPRNFDINFLWFFYLGLGALCLVGLFGYASIVVGHWRCLLNVPERKGARWLLFTSITCLLMGPALNFFAGFSMEKGLELGKGPGGLAEIRFTPFAQKLQIAGAVTGLASMVCFMLFLRATALCFDDHARAGHVVAYLIYLGLLLIGSLYVGFGRIPPAKTIPILIGLAVGSLISFIWYLCIIAGIRNCISEGLKQVKSPLDFDPPPQAPSYSACY